METTLAGNGVPAGIKTLVKYNENGLKLWELELGNTGSNFGAPIALGKHIYVFGYAVNYDGTIEWQARRAVVCGPRNPSTCYIGAGWDSAVVGDNVIYGNERGGSAAGYAISLDTGLALWRFESVDGLIEGTQCLGSDGTIYRFGINRNYIGKLYAFSSDGTIEWGSELGFLGWNTSTASSLVIHNNVLYIAGGNSGKLYAINVASESVANTPWPMLQHDPMRTGRQDVDFSSRGLVEAFVTRFYQQCLSREPESAGLAYYTDHLINGTRSGADVAGNFINSPEFLARNTTKEEYLFVMYRAFFDREPDNDGWNYYLNKLNIGESRDVVFTGFIYSPEFEDLCDSYGISPYSA